MPLKRLVCTIELKDSMGDWVAYTVFAGIPWETREKARSKLNELVSEGIPADSVRLQESFINFRSSTGDLD
jgi:hypothetical protein